MSAATGAALWGTLGPVASTLTPDELLAAGAARLLVGAVTLFLLAGGVRVLRGWGRADVAPLLVGGLALAVFQFAYYEAVAHAGVATSTAVTIGLAPVVAGAVAALRHRRAPGAGLVVGMVLAVAGVGLVTFGDGSGVAMDPVGLALSVLAAAAFAVQATTIEALTARHTGTGALTGLFAVGALVLLPVALPTAPSSLLRLDGVAAVLHAGVIGGGLAYWLFARGVRHLGAPAAVTITLLEPAAAAVIAVAVLGETVTAVQLAGVVVVCAATVVTALRAREPGDAPVRARRAGPRAASPRLGCLTE